MASKLDWQKIYEALNRASQKTEHLLIHAVNASWNYRDRQPQRPVEQLATV
jgi:hypothetical protein